MTIGALKNLFRETLKADSQADSLFYLTAKHYLNLSKTDVALSPNFDIPKDLLKHFENTLEDLKNHKPIQYILGKQHFFGLDIDVNPNVLIPRPETEELVEYILQTVGHKTGLHVLDIGTGSGCIAIALSLHLKESRVSATDISLKTLDRARANSAKHLSAIDFGQEDILKCTSLQKTYDLIVSNPPYVCRCEKQYMEKNVLDYEPESALFVEDDNPLKFYTKIAGLAKKHLSPQGLLFFEINPRFGKDILRMLTGFGFGKAILRKDFLEKDRFIMAGH